MDDLERQIRELDDKLDDIKSFESQVWRDREVIKAKLFHERMKSIETHKQFYVKKLERIKKYVEAFVGETPFMGTGHDLAYRKGNLRYGFRKREFPYQDDYHEMMQDPLDFMIVEYDLLGMDDHLEIRFDYHSKPVQEFVKAWMRENLPRVHYDDELFGFRN